MTNVLLGIVLCVLGAAVTVGAILSLRWEARWAELERRRADADKRAAWEERERDRVTGVVEQTALRFGVLVPPKERR